MLKTSPNFKYPPNAIFSSPMSLKVAQLGGKPPNLATLTKVQKATLGHLLYESSFDRSAGAEQLTERALLLLHAGAQKL